jgi:all-trans-retinol dehydrogenase (NAD+)
MTDFNNKTVLITGAAHGIGKLMAEKAAALGATLVINDVNGERLGKTADEIRQNGTTVFTHAFDISDRQAVYTAAEEIISEAGKIDILINNAGVVFTGEILTITDEMHIKQVEINLLGTLWMIKAFVPDMVKRNEGHIVNIASSAGLLAIPGMGIYSATKHALMGLNEAFRNELRNNDSKIRTTVVCPYIIKTGMFEGMKTPFWQPGLKPEAMADAVINGILKNREMIIKPWTAYIPPIVKALFPPIVMDLTSKLMGFNKAIYSCNGFMAHPVEEYFKFKSTGESILSKVPLPLSQGRDAKIITEENLDKERTTQVEN